MATTVSTSPGHALPQDPVYYLHNLGLVDGDFLHVPPNATVYMDMEPSPDLGGVLVEGSLIFLTNLDAPELRAGWILIGTSNPSYTPQVKIGSGTSPTPESCQAKITLLGAGGGFSLQDPEDACVNNLNVLTQVESGIDSGSDDARAMLLSALNDSGLVVYEYGKLIAWGADAGVSWTELAITAAESDGVLTVDDDALGLWLGKEIVVASTDYDPDQAEPFMVDDVDPNSIDASWTDLSLVGALGFDHYALTYAPTGHTSEEDWQIREYAEVGLLTRNVIIRAQSNVFNEVSEEYEWVDGSGAHGHVMVCRNESDSGAAIPVARLSWVQFLNLGIEGKMMRYPLHFHYAGEQDNETYPSLVIDCSFTHCFNKFISVHNTQNMTISWNVGYDTIGNGFFLEDAMTTGITLTNNLGIGVRALDLGTFTVGNEDLEPAVFWYASANNKISGNHAAGSSDYGFWYHPGADEEALEFTIDGTDSYFTGNVGHSNAQHGFYQDKIADDEYLTRATPWYASDKFQLADSTFYKNRRYGVWVRSYGRVFLSGLKVADNRSGFYIASDGIQDVINIATSGVDYRTLSYITLLDSLAIGQTTNLGYEDVSFAQEDQANRSLPQRIPWRDWDDRIHDIP